MSSAAETKLGKDKESPLDLTRIVGDFHKKSFGEVVGGQGQIASG